jgi:regulation of enolase protein 1 (concanavalin A-like superfamily)
VLALAEVQVFGATSAADTLLVTTTSRPLPGGTFEGVDATGTLIYDPTGLPWIFIGQSGISGNASGFTSANPNAPEGTQVLFLQNSGSVQQSVRLAAGGYALSFRAAQSGLNSNTAQRIVVFVDGAALGVFNPASTSYALLQTNTFTVAAGPHQIAFAGLGLNPDGSSATNATALVDDVRIVSVPLAPTISTIAAQSSQRGKTASLQIAASDPAGNALTYSATGLPAGLSIGASTGLISGTVSTTAAATNAVTVTVNNGTLSASTGFSWATTAPNRAPTITAVAAQTSVRGQSASLQIAASDPDGQAITYAASGLPAGLSINATGLVSGTVSTTAAATNAVTVTVSDGSLSASTSFAWSTTAPPALPITGGDIGAPGKAGSNSYAAGVYTVSGGGSDIWYNSDQFRFVSQTFTGDGQIIARVTSQTYTQPWAKAGVMFRETLNASSRFAAMELTPGNGTTFQYRTATAGDCGYAVGTSAAAPNNWLRLVRSGNVFTGYRSSDGVTWTQVGSATIPMATAVTVGLVVTSTDNTTSGTATFDNVQIKP